jgi:hypothetical protein
MTSHLPAYDLARLKAAYPEPAKERAALLSLARAASQAERWDDMLRFTREIVRTAQLATPGADLTAEERQLFFSATKQVRLNTWWNENSLCSAGVFTVTFRCLTHLAR